MLQSHAGIVIMPTQDLLGYGSDTRLNIPGNADGNWQCRVTKDQPIVLTGKSLRI